MRTSEEVNAFRRMSLLLVALTFTMLLKRVSAQQETKRGLKAYVLDSLFGLFKLKRKAGTEEQSAKHDDGELQKHEKMRDQAQALLLYKTF